MPFSWFGGIYIDERNFFANFAVDAKKLRDVVSEIKMPDSDWGQFVARSRWEVADAEEEAGIPSASMGAMT